MTTVNSEIWSDFDDAWSTAVKIPDGWKLMSLVREGIDVTYEGGRSEYVEWWRATATGPDGTEVSETGAWPAFALFQLVGALRARG